MTRGEFKTAYVAEMIRLGLPEKLAVDSFEAGEDGYDFNEDDPVYCASEELSYWGEG